MRTVEDYRKRAQEAVELAQRAPASEHAALLNIARAWLRLADQREAALHAESPETPQLKTAETQKA